ncbi:MAG TPA: glycerol-3-phosphate 1-O-acyltransferase PlsY [Ktedonobacteraceae bacterium]|nr:glycerol-3-phosphate 1-O-acyltransferase PlsY [Ktedonobacteraceae bacterium]
MPGILGGIIIALIGYLWGSVPAGYWMGKLLRGKDFDIRDYGSHKIGATNVLRTLGWGPAITVFLFDISKGVGPTLLAKLPIFYLSGWGLTIAALAALVGHVYPVFIGFKGGRGVATGAGAILVISPVTFLIAAIATGSTIAISRYVSLGSIVGGVTSMICGIIFFFAGQIFYVHLPQLVYLILAPAFVIALHHDNIARLLSGKERKIGQKVKIEEGAPAPSNSASHV